MDLDNIRKHMDEQFKKNFSTINRNQRGRGIFVGSDDQNDQPILTKINVWVIAKKLKREETDAKHYMSFQLRDDITVPNKLYEKFLLSSFNVYTIKLTNMKTNETVFAKISSSNSTPRDIESPNWIIEKLNIQEGDKVALKYVLMSPIKKAIFSVPKVFINPKPILEFELTKHSILSKGKEINIKIFDKKFQIIVKTIFDNKGDEIDVGTIVEMNDVEFEIEFI